MLSDIYQNVSECTKSSPFDQKFSGGHAPDPLAYSRYAHLIVLVIVITLFPFAILISGVNYVLR